MASSGAPDFRGFVSSSWSVDRRFHRLLWRPNNSFNPKTNSYAIVFGLIPALGGMDTKQHIERVMTLAERYGVCAALAAGGSLIVSFADKLVFGPLIPQIVGVIVTALAGGLASFAGIDFINSYQARSKLTLILASLLSGVLALAGLYFVGAAVYAANASAAA